MTGFHETFAPDREPDRIAASDCALCDEVAARTAAEEPVHPLDRKACQEHMEVCARCRALDALGPDLTEEARPAEDAEVDALLQAARMHAESNHRRRRSRTALAALAAVFALAGLGIALTLSHWKGSGPALRPTSEPTSLTVASGCLRLHQEGKTACLPGHDALSNDRLFVASSDRVRLERGRDLVVAALHDTRFAVRSQDSAVLIRLQTGNLAVRLRPGRKIGVTVQTDKAKVRVKGTVFSVRNTERDTLVAVAAGRVEVAYGPHSTSRVLLGPGQTFSVRRGGPLPGLTSPNRSLLASLASQSHRDYVLPPAAPPANPGPESASGRNTAQGETARARPPGDHRGGPVHPSKTDKAHPGKNGPAAGRGSGPKTAPGTTPPNNMTLLQKAQACRKAGNWDCALATYRNLADGKGGSPVASALVAMAQIELGHLHRPKAALEHFNRYLSKRPNGALAAEALYGKAQALHALGRRSEERRILRRFLAKFPNSIRAPRVKRRLIELSGTR